MHRDRGKLSQDACGFPKITWFGKQISKNNAVKMKVVKSICEPVRGIKLFLYSLRFFNGGLNIKLTVARLTREKHTNFI